MRYARFLCLLAIIIGSASALSAQYVSVAVGALFPQNLSGGATPGSVGGQASANFTKSPIFTADGGFNFLPFIGAGLHYSYAKPELDLRRSDAFGSRAVAEVAAQTITFDLRVNSVKFNGFRVYGFGGVGVSRFNLNVKSQVEVPFPKGVPGDLVGPVGTFGGGIERSFFPYLATKLEIRDYITPISSNIYVPGGMWHRVAIVGGIRFGR